MEISRPDELKPDERECFIRFVENYGHIPNKRYIRKGIESARTLIRLHVNDKLIGVAAVKCPDTGYKAAAFAKACSMKKAGSFDFELGYIAVRPDCEGIGLGTALAKLAMKSVPNPSQVYATVRQSNEGSRKLLTKCGFAQEGSSYLNQKGDTQILLFVGPKQY